MKNSRRIVVGLLLLSLAGLACGALTPTEATAPVAATASTQVNGGPSAVPSAVAATPTEREQAVTPTATARPTATPEPTAAKLELELVQSQTWLDSLGNARTNVLLHNPYDFPVAPGSRGWASILNAAGEILRSGELYFLDGISGGGGFILPGETIAANVCYTCEAALLTEDWASVEIQLSAQDATGEWNYSTEVEPSVSEVKFKGDSPIFYITGSVKNNSAGVLDRISVRVFVYDQDGQLVGAAEGAAYDVEAGATGQVSSYGIGQAPDGPITYEVTALGVNY